MVQHPHPNAPDGLSTLRVTTNDDGRIVYVMLNREARMNALSAALLGELVTDACELYEAVAEDKDQRFEQSVDNTVSIEGDRDLLFQMVSFRMLGAIRAYALERLAEGPVRVGLSFKGLPGGATPDHVTVHEVPWTDTAQGVSVAAALPEDSRKGKSRQRSRAR